MKNYECYGEGTIKLIASKKNDKFVLVKDVYEGLIMTSKHINYIKAFGLELNTPYYVEYAVYTNERGYTEVDFCKVHMYKPVQTGKKPSEKSPQAAPFQKSSKPAWLR